MPDELDRKIMATVDRVALLVGILATLATAYGFYWSLDRWILVGCLSLIASGASVIFAAIIFGPLPEYAPLNS